MLLEERGGKWKEIAGAWRQQEGHGRGLQQGTPAGLMQRQEVQCRATVVRSPLCSKLTAIENV